MLRTLTWRKCNSQRHCKRDTDLDGRYSVKAKTGDVLFFSFLGMENKLVTVGASSVINVKLSQMLKSQAR
jgi:hypothetical protein